MSVINNEEARPAVILPVPSALCMCLACAAWQVNVCLHDLQERMSDMTGGGLLECVGMWLGGMSVALAVLILLWLVVHQ